MLVMFCLYQIDSTGVNIDAHNQSGILLSQETYSLSTKSEDLNLYCLLLIIYRCNQIRKPFADIDELNHHLLFDMNKWFHRYKTMIYNHIAMSEL